LNSESRSTTKTDRDEGDTIKIYGLGGEVALPRDQVQSILRGEEGQARGLDLRDRAAGNETKPNALAPAPNEVRPSSETAAPPEDEKTKQENEYRKKVHDL